jgi:ABC-type branched-subunit amino acid transport system substrate-binding protein
MKKCVLVAQALVSVIWCLLSAATCVIAGDTIRLGFVADATGVGESWYKGQKAGIELFIEEINASGGVHGRIISPGITRLA